ncbi:MAG: hypothetical protein ACW98Y_01795 [Candidatus Thorarchaeota archaeon]|jgi:hypothetical protein
MSEDVVTGRAENAKGGAVVVTSDGDVIYINGVDSWDDDIVGKDVIAKGRLSHEKFIPDPIIEEDGAISQGAEGLQTVLHNVEWKLK